MGRPPLCNIVINWKDPPLCNIVINRADPSPPIRYYVIYGRPLIGVFSSNKFAADIAGGLGKPSADLYLCVCYLNLNFSVCYSYLYFSFCFLFLYILVSFICICICVCIWVSDICICISCQNQKSFWDPSKQHPNTTWFVFIHKPFLILKKVI